MTEMVYGTVRPSAREPILPRWWRTVDKGALLAILGLFAIGLLLGLAASPPLATRNGLPPFHYVQRQMVFGGAALSVMLVLSLCDPKQIRRMGTLLFLGAFIALAFLPLFGTDFGKGATRWYSLGFASVQPSEFLKPGFIILSAWLLAAAQEINGPPGRSLSLGITLAVVGLLVIQPDFGQACLILFGWASMYFVAGASMVLVVSLVAAVGLGGIAAYNLSEHFQRRIDGFLSSDLDPTTQLGYATNAIREGGFFGVGVGEGQVKWVLPDAHTDFIIAVAAEEYGVLLVMVIIALYATVVLRSLWRLMRERDPFARLAGTGLTLLFAAQAIINMGVAVRMLPAKGMTLPLVSYGGSSLIATGIALGFLLAFTRSRPQGQIEDILIKRGR
ncbi:peptidoglycan glycosyltransferase FtsW [Dinoroseobacter sp. S124A]|uniref:peptidoglycan glycosyltransferase FtsW n=1 Tax=Dinoroseobacter sp. S124A TaxID=3415128 RepID=UPI003C7B2172